MSGDNVWAKRDEPRYGDYQVREVMQTGARPVKARVLKPSTGLAKSSSTLVQTGQNATNDKRSRILDAAQNLFLRYGVKRTSLDHVVRDAGIAKGTLYLYFDSKGALFAAIAERLCDEMLSQTEEAIASNRSLIPRIVGCLDAFVGSSHRLTAHSPHIAELTESTEALAASIFEAFNENWRGLLRKVLREGGIRRKDAVDIFYAAAAGTLKTGDSAAKPYRARLTAIASVLVAGMSENVPRNA
jgi:AcrR family transcriptional regulator